MLAVCPIMFFNRHHRCTPITITLSLHSSGMMIAFLIIGVLTGCAGLESALTEQSVNERRQFSQDAKTCTKIFTAMNQATKSVADAEAMRISGFPYLRINRFLASYEPKHLTGNAFVQWLNHLRALDRQARRIEFANLPKKVRARHKNMPHKIERCAELLMTFDLKQPAQKKALLNFAHVPDAYNRWAQVAGLYPLSVIPVRFGIMHLQESQRDDFENSFRSTKLRVYAPNTAQAYNAHTVQKIFKKTQYDALGIPLYQKDDLENLFTVFAPVFEIDTQSDDDKPGSVAYDATGQLKINTKTPTVYHRLAFTRFRGRVLTQLVYTIWFPARTATGPLDIFAGKLDGLMWRVTLDHRGQPMMYDAIHPCGCYHLFFPVRPWVIANDDQHQFHGEPPVAPIAGPMLKSGQRIHLRLKTASHYLTAVVAKRTDHQSSQRYRIDDENMLRSLPHPMGRKSLYGTDGLIEESERPERFLLWPMGVASAGAMRQWGHHATAFIGTRHFDDADLIERILTRER